MVTVVVRFEDVDGKVMQLTDSAPEYTDVDEVWNMVTVLARKLVNRSYRKLIAITIEARADSTE